MKKFVLAAAQFAVRPNAVAENTQKACDWISLARKEHGARLVVLPETVTTGFTPGMPAAELWGIAPALAGPIIAKVRRAAKALGVWVLFPTYERGPEKGVVYNSAVLVSDKGKISGVYRKTHPFPTERIGGDEGGWTTPGTELPVFETPFAKIGVTICYEGDFPELSRILALKGAEVILRPAAFLRSFEVWDLTNRARAYDNHVFFAGVNAVGADAEGNYYFGHSMIVSPLAQKLAQARGTEEIIAAEAAFDPARYVTYGSKTRRIFDHLEDRNVHLYEEILARPTFAHPILKRKGGKPHVR